jgi:hypothetical protein
MTLVFGGSSCGMMKLLADTMLEHNGKVIGIFTKSLPEKFIRHDLTESVITEANIPVPSDCFLHNLTKLHGRQIWKDAKGRYYVWDRLHGHI